MEHRFSIPNILTSYLGSKGIFYSGIFLNKTGRSRAQGGDYEVPEGIGATAETDNAIPLRAEDVLGSHYFMPVWLQPSGGERVEIPNAVISMTGRKNIVETQLIGTQGSVKELISLADYEISLVGTVVGDSIDSYPEAGVRALSELYKRNESIELICALTDIVLGADCDVVIKSISFPAVGAYENQQIVEMSLTTDRMLELEEV